MFCFSSGRSIETPSPTPRASLVGVGTTSSSGAFLGLSHGNPATSATRRFHGMAQSKTLGRYFSSSIWSVVRSVITATMYASLLINFLSGLCNDALQLCWTKTKQVVKLLDSDARSTNTRRGTRSRLPTLPFGSWSTEWQSFLYTPVLEQRAIEWMTPFHYFLQRKQEDLVAHV